MSITQPPRLPLLLHPLCLRNEDMHSIQPGAYLQRGTAGIAFGIAFYSTHDNGDPAFHYILSQDAMRDPICRISRDPQCPTFADKNPLLGERVIFPERIVAE